MMEDVGDYYKRSNGRRVKKIGRFIKWKFYSVHWHRQGNCWTWWKIRRSVYFSGNSVYFVWGRLGIVFERTKWIKPNEKVEAPK